MVDVTWAELLSEQVLKHHRLMFRVAYGVLRNKEQADEVCQEAVVLVLQKHQTIRSLDSLRPWLARTVLNCALQVVRRSKTERAVLRKHAQLQSAVELPPVNLWELRETLLLAMQQLPETRRLVVAMRVLQGMSGNQVADSLGLKAPAVAIHLHAGLKQLKKLLEPLGLEMLL